MSSRVAARIAVDPMNGILKLIDEKFGTMPIAALEDKRARGEFKTFRGVIFCHAPHG